MAITAEPAPLRNTPARPACRNARHSAMPGTKRRCGMADEERSSEQFRREFAAGEEVCREQSSALQVGDNVTAGVLSGKHGAGLLGRQCDIGNHGDEVESLRDIRLGDQYARSVFAASRQPRNRRAERRRRYPDGLRFRQRREEHPQTRVRAAELTAQENSRDDRGCAGTETDAERDVVLHVELYGRK